MKDHIHYGSKDKREFISASFDHTSPEQNRLKFVESDARATSLISHTKTALALAFPSKLESPRCLCLASCQLWTSSKDTLDKIYQERITAHHTKATFSTCDLRKPAGTYGLRTLENVTFGIILDRNSG